jgi:hypothetical protein
VFTVRRRLIPRLADPTPSEAEQLRKLTPDAPRLRRQARVDVPAIETAITRLLAPLEDSVASELLRAEIDLTRRMLNGVLGSPVMADLRRRLARPLTPLQVCHGDATVVCRSPHPRAGSHGDGCGIVYRGHTRGSGWTRCSLCHSRTSARNRHRAARAAALEAGFAEYPLYRRAADGFPEPTGETRWTGTCRCGREVVANRPLTKCPACVRGSSVS